ncbi:MAG TPA: tryptophanase [Candidatus Marinimicrobia bacterium]|nr:tryptophanase [Candidatus Neomarinimicrobiota bacterium]
MKKPIEPFRIKSVEAIPYISREEREKIIKEAGYNVFLISSDKIYIDLLTDSGTSAMSDNQWAGLMHGDESYAGSRNYFHFEETIRELTGFKYIIPTHQGRVTENLLFSVIMKPGQLIPNNSHFDTTRANVEAKGGIAKDLLYPWAHEPDYEHPFKGNINLEALEALIQETGAENIPLGMITVTNNSGGGQPVAMDNIRSASEIYHKYGIPLFLDACRFAENAWFIKSRDPKYHNTSIRDIVLEMFSYADGCTMSAKKDGLVNIGGFLALNNAEWNERISNQLILIEGFPTYGGLAGRDLEAISRGLKEVVDERYLEYRIGQIAAIGEMLDGFGIPYVRPAGGHAIYIDAKRFLPHIPPHQFPAQALVAALFVEGGIRGVEIGSLMFGSADPKTGKFQAPQNELVRLAVPRRVYSYLHLEYVVQALAEIYKKRDKIKGLRLVYEAPALRHFTARLAEID